MAPIMYNPSPLSCTQAQLFLLRACVPFLILLHWQTWSIECPCLRQKNSGRGHALSLRKEGVLTVMGEAPSHSYRHAVNTLR